MTTAVRKYLFDQSFDGPPPGAPGAPGQPKRESKISTAELDAARAAAFAEGKAAGEAAATKLIEAHLAATLETAATFLSQIAAEQGSATAEHARITASLAAAILGRIAPSLARRTALDDIATLFSRALAEAIEEPRLVLRVATTLFEPVRARMAPLAEHSGYAGKLIILADDTLGPADARVEWADGGAERDLARLTRDIESAMQRLLDAPDPTEAAPRLTPGE
jgi:flagellar assembly protein FliH